MSPKVSESEIDEMSDICKVRRKRIGTFASIQLRAFDYIRLPFYEAKVLFSEGRGRM